MKRVATLLGILAGALTLACSTLTTAVDYDHTVNWSQFHTFALAEGTKDPETFTQKRIEDGITQSLQSKGWTVATSNPDVVVYSHVVLSSEKQWNATSMGGFGYRGWGGMGGGMATATQTNIPIGTIIVDMVNPKTKEMIWRGTAQDQVSGTGADRGQVQQAMQELFKNFPPGSGKS
ncbi:MAG TPA: DUF4136 domain-containing protein [Thermoanaerobaculia bacterium]|nr:DUF4136 domain-containing protein [Thermoanaerobaculia bacterium]